MPSKSPEIDQARIAALLAALQTQGPPSAASAPVSSISPGLLGQANAMLKPVPSQFGGGNLQGILGMPGIGAPPTPDPNWWNKVQGIPPGQYPWNQMPGAPKPNGGW